MPQRLFNMLNTPANKYLLRTSLPSILSLSMFGLSLGISSTTFAASISYQQAEQSVLQDSYSTQATQALQQASKLEAEAVKGLGLPRIDLNVRAYAFHNELDVPLGALKNNLEHTLTDGVATKIDEWQNTYPNLGDLSGLEQGIDQTIHKGVGLFVGVAQQGRRLGHRRFWPRLLHFRVRQGHGHVGGGAHATQNRARPGLYLPRQ